MARVKQKHIGLGPLCINDAQTLIINHSIGMVAGVFLYVNDGETLQNS
jgi:hypothetical protein